jgi:hypothetical protein
VYSKVTLSSFFGLFCPSPFEITVRVTPITALTTGKTMDWRQKLCSLVKGKISMGSSPDGQAFGEVSATHERSVRMLRTKVTEFTKVLFISNVC